MTTTLESLAKTDWYMAGTEGTGEYLAIARNNAGRIGVRVLGPSHVRVRIEPSGSDGTDKLAKHFTSEDGWQQPDSQQRFSKVFSGDTVVPEIEAAIASLRKEGKLTRNTAVRLWRKSVTA